MIKSEFHWWTVTAQVVVGMELIGERRSSYTFLSTCYQLRKRVSLFLCHFQMLGMDGGWKNQGKHSFRIEPGYSHWVGQPRGGCEQGVECLLRLGKEKNPLHAFCSWPPPCPKPCRRPFTSPLLLFMELLWMCVRASQARERDL